jgi:hypothetical protein
MDDSTTERDSMIDIERRLLQILCQRGDEVAVREKARGQLANYHWSEDAHQAIFDIVMSFPSTSCQALREQLPARLTRRGFPDFDFDALFAVAAPSSSEAECWMGKLLQAW